MPSNNPFKGTPRGAWIVGGVVAAGVGLYVYMKNKQAKAAAAAAAAQPGQYGYGYGVSPIYGYGQGGTGLGFPFSGYGGGGYGGGQAPTTNAQWAQAAEGLLVQNGYDAMTVAAALGKYLTGQPCTADQANIIQAAIAFEGYPPQNGPNGFPPNINTSSGGGGGNAQNPVTGLHVSQPGSTGVDVAWNPSSGATSYQVTASKGNVSMLGATSARIHSINPPGHPSSATVTVLAQPAAQGAQSASITVHTH